MTGDGCSEVIIHLMRHDYAVRALDTMLFYHEESCLIFLADATTRG
jgi:hypothetical protein